jgi:3-oxoacyl-[acyl-carrier protein] reductase
MANIEGTTALVTGASRGIGAATAVALAQNGVRKIAIHYNSNQSGAEQVAGRVAKLGAEPALIQADLGSEEGVRQFCGRIRETPYDILINNAGHLVGRATLPEATEDLYDRVMTLNVKSLYFITQAVVPHMVGAQGGVIVNLSSIAARNGGGIGATLYSAAKAAVATMTKGMAKELAPKGIRVNAVSPGTVDNDFHSRYSTPEMLKAVVAATPAGRLGTNEEVADVILFLCSDASRYIYGQTIEINGGMYMV